MGSAHRTQAGMPGTLTCRAEPAHSESHSVDELGWVHPNEELTEASQPQSQPTGIKLAAQHSIASSSLLPPSKRSLRVGKQRSGLRNAPWSYSVLAAADPRKASVQKKKKGLEFVKPAE